MPGRTPDKDMSVLFEAMVKVGFRTFPLWRFSTRAVAKWVDSEGLHLPYPRTRTVQGKIIPAELIFCFSSLHPITHIHLRVPAQKLIISTPKFNFTMPARRCEGSSDEHEYDPARPPAGSAEEIEWELAYNRAELLAVDEAIQRDQRLLAAANMAIILWRWIRSRRAAALVSQLNYEEEEDDDEKPKKEKKEWAKKKTFINTQVLPAETDQVPLCEI
ncbi:hypothetical protein FIE12Z_11766 [Fusarium flagelliforme]|uniref:Uncharacterized protein n=1 Tax=Fusarium flagelliforme TaxID=2675880 RepID=A0A395M802_9HYPO|nr:hypothetical protein FIE12Z_11766 [Fusarium flagelliforme]